MEAKSVEDNGAGLQFCVFVYNSQPQITINYATGESSMQTQAAIPSAPAPSQAQTVIPSTPSSSQVQTVQPSSYILNENTHLFHKPECSAVKRISEANKKTYTGTRTELIAQGYQACKLCNP